MDAFAALADPVRRSLLRALAAGPRRVVDLADGLPISRPAVSKHLRLLAEAGLVEAEERGRERHYTLRRAGLAPLTAYVEGLVLPQPLTPNALDALDTEVRRVTRDRRTTSVDIEETA
ncbi:ArsR family transcriptional regulator [Nocardioides sp. Root1257]|uniref:ArsR/SmtB family transcription factor n=1 Tax=unclassified Nocardioides TaxID=2615069 RepID=UPI0006F83791|nr:MULTISPECIES: metalloregulator ArsR/SmtB family transcription factor [unclassified Nocardioides]KQW43910.1 ArsR family transcriptional regulator [Nocardioides sp. Root1257]KRC42351.1 ArsR family transcriptional regulator [Nocardioides sp. Root224]